MWDVSEDASPPSSTLSVVPNNNNQGLLASTKLNQKHGINSSSSSAPSSGNSIDAASSTATAEGERHRRHSVNKETTTLDFIGTGPAVKTLFSIPIIAKQSVCVAVHNIDGTLLIDEVVPEEDDHDDDYGEISNISQNISGEKSNGTSVREALPPSSRSLALALSPASSENYSSETGNSTPHQHEALKALSQIIQKAKQEHSTEIGNTDDTTDKKNHYSKKTRSLMMPPLSPPPVREYVEWNFQEMNLLVGSDALIVRPENNNTNNNRDASSGLVIRVEEVHQLRRLMELQEQEQQKQQQQQQQHCLEDEEEKDGEDIPAAQNAQRSYADVLLQPMTTRTLLTDAAGDASETDSKDADDDSPSTPLNLDQVQLQTCIVPTSGPLGGWFKSKPNDNATANAVPGVPTDAASSSKCIVLDAYLDNLMANVPQLALCLQEKGLIQSVKLLDRDQIPAMMMHPTTLDTTKPVETIRQTSSSAPNTPDLFSPEIMEMNATALLRFLKANCTSNNTTYLLRTDASATDGNNIQLYDISSISQQRQKKWIWWLATMSYRFALRLRQLESHDVLPMRQRAFRDRQRSLLQTTLDLLQDLRDMDGNAHESLVASVREHMADTFLGENNSSGSSSESPSNDNAGSNHRASSPTGNSSASPPPVMASSSSPPNLSSFPVSGLATPPVPATTRSGSPTHSQQQQQQQQQTQHQPYPSITTDALYKAQDHLVLAIKALWPVLEDQIQPPSSSTTTADSTTPPVTTGPRRRKRGESGATAPSSPQPTVKPSSAMVSQLFGLNYKAVNVTLRLAEHYLGQYSSSSAMQSLRHAARRMADTISLLEYLASAQDWIPRLRLQYTWLWEHCGHFARSFASDDLWRERGHASGDDVLYVLRDVEAAFGSALLPYDFSNLPDPIRAKTKGLVSLQSLSALYAPKLGELKKAKQEEPPIWEETRTMLSNQGLLQRDKRQVLVASCISYNRAIVAFQEMDELAEESPALLNLLRQRLGDACNEIGKVLLASLRRFLTKRGEQNLGLADVLLDSAQFWFLEGLEAFESSGDPQNIALLRCNLCQCCKLRANNSFNSQATTEASHAEVCLEKAASHLQAAHETLGTRDIDPVTWDMVSNELAATFLVLAVRRRQSLLGGGATPVVLTALRLSPGKERSIIEPMEKALAIYQQSGNFHQAAAVQYQLALTNSKVWTCQRDEAKTREKLSAAFTQYQHAFAYFGSHLRGNEPTFVLLCMDIASLYAVVSGEECVVKALTRCLDTVDAFSREAIEGAGQSSEWFEKMETLASSVDDRVFKLLRSLVKLDADRWKDLYREGLSAKMIRKDDTVEPTFSAKALPLLNLHEVLVALREKIHSANVDTGISS
jgi:hypothetical protein